nr:cadherin-like beta sandwich domain-containing protein [uncultured Carboxylicivirga sp.]
MKKRFLLQTFWFFILILGVSVSPALGQTLMHSYSFEEGTYDETSVYDQTGSVNGTLVGTPSIVNGELVFDSNGDYVTFDGSALDLNSYTGGITIEFMYNSSVGANDGHWNWFTYFGGAEGASSIMAGVNTWGQFRVYKNNTDPKILVDSKDDAKYHHAVVIMTDAKIAMYVDGALIGEQATATYAIDAAYAYLGRAYWNDPTWEGVIDQFNIYQGEMDATTVMSNFINYVGEDYVNADLAVLSAVPGEMTPAFDPQVLEYDLYVPYGSTEAVFTVETAAGVATYEMTTGAGAIVGEDGVVTFDEFGEDVEIAVAALSGNEKFYYVYINLNDGTTSERLSDIQVAGGTLVTDFDPDVTDYNVRADYGATSVTLTGVPMWANATVTGDGTINLTDGAATATIHVVSEDGLSEMDYNLNIYATDVQVNTNYYIQHELSGYVIGEREDTYIRLYEPLKDETSQIIQFKESDVAGQYYIQNNDGNYLRLALASGTNVWDMVMDAELTGDLDSCKFELDEFEKGRFRIVSVARANDFENVFMGTNDSNLGTGIYSDKWLGNDLAVWSIISPDQVETQYNTYLASLSIGGNELYPVFDPYVNEYRVVLPEGTTEFILDAVAQDATCTISGDGTIDVSTVKKGSVTITVTATNTSYTRDYVIKYHVYNEDFALMHSYTFLDGTAKDVVGGADGIIHGGTITEGMYNAGTLGDYIELPAGDIAINTYASITFEHFIVDDPNTTNANLNTMVTSFGNSGTYGYDYIFTATKSRAAISCQNSGSPWSSESGADGSSVDDDNKGMHHLVTIITKDAIKLYLDGVMQSAGALTTTNGVVYLSDAYAYICKSVYPGDNTWLGSIYEFNIYAGVMDDASILLNASNGPQGYAGTDATLSDLAVDGVTIDGFAPTTYDYTVSVAAGSDPAITLATNDANATYTIDGPASIPGVATIVVTAADLTTKKTYTITFDVASGIDLGSKQSSSKVYPTVSRGEFTVEMEGASSMITVYDLAGGLVKQVKTAAKREVISLSQKGMYLVKVESDGKSELFKVFKK